MPVISKKFADELSNDKEARDAYLEEKTRVRTAIQVKSIRADRGWSQAELGDRMGKPQSNVHRLEDIEVARYTLTTLLELASAYDCGLVVDFVPYEEFLRRTENLSPDNFRVPPFARSRLDALTQDEALYGVIPEDAPILVGADPQQGTFATTTGVTTSLTGGFTITNVQPVMFWGLGHWSGAVWGDPVASPAVTTQREMLLIRERDRARAEREIAIQDRDRTRAECQFLRNQLTSQGMNLWPGGEMAQSAPTTLARIEQAEPSGFGLLNIQAQQTYGLIDP